MRVDPRNTGPGGLQQLREHPGRALVVAIAAAGLCVLGAVMVLVVYAESGHFPWYQAAVPALMALVAVLSGLWHLVEHRKQRRMLADPYSRRR